MLPIYKEYITFLNSNKIKEKWLIQGYFWINNNVIKGYYIENGELKVEKLLRLKAEDDLTINKKYYSGVKYDRKWLSWEELFEWYKNDINKLESDSLELIQSSKYFKDSQNIVLTSGGKDSILTTHLVKKVINSPRLIFNNTSMDVAETYRYIKQNNIEIINPKEGFYQWRKRINFIPTRFARACCNKFKEGEMISYLNKDEKLLFIMGMRNEESSNRAIYGDEWKNNKWGNRDWNAILPIRKWTEIYLWLYTIHNKLDINLKYKMGYPRVGCGIACPYYSKSIWSLDKYWYNKLFVRWQNILKNDFIDNNKGIIMNCTMQEYLLCWNGGTYRKAPTIEVIEEFAEINNISYAVAKNYFNHNCEKCGKRIKNKEVLSMNMKLHGRNINKLYCKKHLMDMYNLSETDWKQKVLEFKDAGCDLF